jgi:hypothetical protein
MSRAPCRAGVGAGDRSSTPYRRHQDSVAAVIDADRSRSRAPALGRALAERSRRWLSRHPVLVGPGR